jgi:hypothetical protein
MLIKPIFHLIKLIILIVLGMSMGYIINYFVETKKPVELITRDIIHPGTISYYDVNNQMVIDQQTQQLVFIEKQQDYKMISISSYTMYPDAGIKDVKRVQLIDSKQQEPISELLKDGSCTYNDGKTKKQFDKEDRLCKVLIHLESCFNHTP